MLLHTVCNYHRAVLLISWLDYLLTWQMLVVKLWTLYCEIINNILFLLKNMSCVTMSFRTTFLTPKLDIPSIAPLPWPAAPYLQMILNLMSLASFEEEEKSVFTCIARTHCHTRSTDLHFWCHSYQWHHELPGRQRFHCGWCRHLNGNSI